MDDSADSSQSPQLPDSSFYMDYAFNEQQGSLLNIRKGLGITDNSWPVLRAQVLASIKDAGLLDKLASASMSKDNYRLMEVAFIVKHSGSWPLWGPVSQRHPQWFTDAIHHIFVIIKGRGRQHVKRYGSYKTTPQQTLAMSKKPYLGSTGSPMFFGSSTVYGSGRPRSENPLRPPQRWSAPPTLRATPQPQRSGAEADLKANIFEETVVEPYPSDSEYENEKKQKSVLSHDRIHEISGIETPPDVVALRRPDTPLRVSKLPTFQVEIEGSVFCLVRPKKLVRSLVAGDIKLDDLDFDMFEEHLVKVANYRKKIDSIWFHQPEYESVKIIDGETWICLLEMMWEESRHSLEYFFFCIERGPTGLPAQESTSPETPLAQIRRQQKRKLVRDSEGDHKVTSNTSSPPDDGQRPKKRGRGRPRKDGT